MSTCCLRALRWQRPSGAIPSRSRCLRLRRRAASSYIDTPPLSTVAHCLRLHRWQRSSGIPSGTIPSRSRRLRLHHRAASSYVDMPPLSTVAHCLHLHHRQRSSGTPSGVTSSRSRHRYLRRHVASAYIIGNDPRYSLGGYPEPVTPPQATSSCCLQLRQHVASIYGGTLPPLVSSATILGYSLRGYLESVTPPLSMLTCCLCLHRQNDRSSTRSATSKVSMQKLQYRCTNSPSLPLFL
jgi:hypothetical protein